MNDDVATRPVGQERRPIQDYLDLPPAEIASRYVRHTPAGRRGLNLGCGGMTFRDWLNIDNEHPHHCDILWDLTQGLPFLPAGQFDAMFSEHFLEHVPREAAMLILRDSLRALRSGGHVRLALPDLRRFAMSYLYVDQPNSKDQDDGIRQEFGKVSGTACELFNYGMRGMGHAWIYDRTELTWLLSHVGFVEIRACKIRESSVPLLHNREVRSADESALILEAKKPSPE